MYIEEMYRHSVTYSQMIFFFLIFQLDSRKVSNLTMVGMVSVLATSVPGYSRNVGVSLQNCGTKNSYKVKKNKRCWGSIICSCLFEIFSKLVQQRQSTPPPLTLIQTCSTLSSERTKLLIIHLQSTIIYQLECLSLEGWGRESHLPVQTCFSFFF